MVEKFRKMRKTRCPYSEIGCDSKEMPQCDDIGHQKLILNQLRQLQDTNSELRRKLKVACSVEDILCDTLQQSITTSQVQPSTSIDEVMHDVRQNSTLKKRYNEFVDSNLTKRIRSDPNHTAERFPNSAARFKSDKS